jgi:hypothetical protein
MSQKDPTRAVTPIVHRYDPKQPVTMPLPQAADPAKPAAGNPPAGERPQDSRSGANRPGANRPVEIGGPSGPEPTRYGDWERNGRVSDF